MFFIKETDCGSSRCSKNFWSSKNLFIKRFLVAEGKRFKPSETSRLLKAKDSCVKPDFDNADNPSVTAFAVPLPLHKGLCIFVKENTDCGSSRCSKSFWSSKNLFIKRFLVAEGKKVFKPSETIFISALRRRR